VVCGIIKTVKKTTFYGEESVMDKNLYVTVTGINHYFGQKPFEPGRVIKLVKDRNNEYDSEAIAVKLPQIGKIGYIANSVHTVIQGTHSAGRLYDKIGKKAYAEVMFITRDSVIAKIIDASDVKKVPYDYDILIKDIYGEDDDDDEVKF